MLPPCIPQQFFFSHTFTSVFLVDEISMGVLVRFVTNPLFLLVVSSQRMFYITPPSGNIRLEKFQLAAISRVNYLVETFVKSSSDAGTKNRVGANYDVCWLIDGTAKDVVSHFLLRLACCDDPDLSSAFVSLETDLFRARVSKMTLNERTKLVSNARNQVGEVIDWDPRSHDGGDKHLAVFCKLYAALSGFVCAWKVSSSSPQQVPVLVPFDSVLAMVSKRSVVLSNGEAVLLSDRYQIEALCCLFELAITSGMSALRSSIPRLARRGDDRVQAVTEAIRNSLAKRLASKRPNMDLIVDRKQLPAVTASQVDLLAKHTFPP